MIRDITLPEGFKVAVVGDLHVKGSYGYAASFPDRRESERQAIYEEIRRNCEGTELVVLLGDVFDGRSNPSGSIREFTAFLESLGDRHVVIMGGNHDTFSDGSGALDYIREIRGKKWHVVTGDPETLTAGGKTLHFVPYMRCTHTGHKDVAELTEWIMTSIPTGCDMVFTHHAVSSSRMNHGSTDLLKGEPVLPRERLKASCVRSFHGHIHRPSNDESTFVVGSVMNEEVGEDGRKSMAVASPSTGLVVSFELPGRSLWKVEAKTLEEGMEAAAGKDFARISLSERPSDSEISALPKNIEIVVAPKERKETDAKPSEDLSRDSLTPEKLLSKYAKNKNVSEERIQRGWALVSAE
jgi:hypothetical protein